MDSQTQALLGAVTAQLGFRQRIGRDATLVAAAAAYSPDLDSYLAPLAQAFGHSDPFARIILHRSVTHSLIVVPVIALLFAWPWWRIRCRRARLDPGNAQPPASFGLLYLCCFVAVLTHAPLDWCTSYGTQILLPFTNTRYGIDAVGIMDFIYTPLLVVTLMTCWRVRRGKANRRRWATAWIGLAGLVLSIGYLAAGRVAHDWAVAKARAQVGDRTIVSANAYPMIGTILLWRTVVETREEWIVMRQHVFADPSATPRTERVAKPPPNPWIEAAGRTRAYEVQRWFTSGCFRVAYREEDGRHIVELHDMRFSLSTTYTESLWPVRITFTHPDRPPKVERLRMHRNVNIGYFARRLWTDIWNP